MHTIFQFWKLLIFKLKIKCIHCIDHYFELIKDDFKAHVFWLLKKQSKFSPSVLGRVFFFSLGFGFEVCLTTSASLDSYSSAALCLQKSIYA